MGFITKTTTHLKLALNNNKDLCHENLSITRKTILSLMKAKVGIAYYTFTLPLHAYTQH